MCPKIFVVRLMRQISHTSRRGAGGRRVQERKIFFRFVNLLLDRERTKRERKVIQPHGSSSRSQGANKKHFSNFYTFLRNSLIVRFYFVLFCLLLQKNCHAIKSSSCSPIFNMCMCVCDNRKRNGNTHVCVCTTN